MYVVHIALSSWLGHQGSHTSTLDNTTTTASSSSTTSTITTTTTTTTTTDEEEDGSRRGKRLPSVCLSVCLSLDCPYCVKTAAHFRHLVGPF